jgi:signal transduction histidine kinase
MMIEEIQSGHSVKQVREGGLTIRAQLLLASLFPLVCFGLLSILVTSSAFNKIIISQILERTSAQVQILADELVRQIDTGLDPSVLDFQKTLQRINPVQGSNLYLLDAEGMLIGSAEKKQNQLSIPMEELISIMQVQNPSSIVVKSVPQGDEHIVSVTKLPTNEWIVVLTEPLSENMKPAFYYQLLLVVLLMLGTIFSLWMLSLSIGRVILPIATLAKNATSAIPGSIFHPVPERGPLEIRSLTNAFNKMVIRLAEQQNILRQYAHKALLSQEEERQRISHELHDGTLQDLIGLTQRVELCRSELDSDPLMARQRLNELHALLEQTLDDVRRISNALRPPVLEDFGLQIALDSLCKDIQEEKPSLHCQYLVKGRVQRLQPDLELAVYRVVQEALANVRKHAQNATKVNVHLSFEPGEIHATVENNGTPILQQNLQTLVRSGHLGLVGMVERARLFGGTLEITAIPGQKTVIFLKLPVDNDSFLITNP